MVVDVVIRIPFRIFLLHNNTFWYYYLFQYQILQDNIRGIKNGNQTADNDTECDSKEDDSEMEDRDSNQIEKFDSYDN